MIPYKPLHLDTKSMYVEQAKISYPYHNGKLISLAHISTKKYRQAR